ncbi:helix-turn-helix domain-containing protein [Schleiferilactobacillus perolens]|jgi:excisionase family DNA binding protein|uniref:helix-turn-helix domain-containing protein n=1 Tax=Schleiferilactobacillus perolens TaxID=100468 RepID=UPI0023567363|nr:helix-turn-helix domain-containing protein [Schleiferilactobacillus perolens]MCI2170989.1 helix-turn-helix domain-containing protein [Schleiferilactobacillus perolens]
MEMKMQLPSDFETELKSQIVAIVAEALATVTNRPQAPEYMDIGGAADYLAVSRGTMMKFIRMGLPMFKVDGTTRIKRTELDKFMALHTI